MAVIRQCGEGGQQGDNKPGQQTQK